MRYPSSEVRWFFDGVPDKGLINWFLQSHTEASEGSRTDHYLLGTGEGLNLKLRQGRIEAKQRMGEDAILSLSNGMAGQCEEWVKWSFELSDNYVPLAEAYPGAWLAIHKRRLLRTFIPEGEEITETGAGSYPGRGCNAELTVVTALDQPWYTIGLESFGASKDLPGLLRSVSTFFFDADFPLFLRPAQSMSYAAWIERNFVH